MVVVTAIVPGLGAYWIYGWAQRIVGARVRDQPLDLLGAQGERQLGQTRRQMLGHRNPGLADAVSVVVYGEVIASDVPEKIRSNAAVQEAYLGTEAA